jgi:hypothetical protein
MRNKATVGEGEEKEGQEEHPTKLVEDGQQRCQDGQGGMGSEARYPPLRRYSPTASMAGQVSFNGQEQLRCLLAV